jgi:hypothetical protein
MKTIDEILKFIEYYTKQGGLITERKYLEKNNPHHIKGKWLPITHALDNLVNATENRNYTSKRVEAESGM